MNTTDLAEKYIDKIPKNISIKTTVNYILNNNLQDRFMYVTPFSRLPPN